MLQKSEICKTVKTKGFQQRGHLFIEFMLQQSSINKYIWNQRQCCEYWSVKYLFLGLVD